MGEKIFGKAFRMRDLYTSREVDKILTTDRIPGHLIGKRTCLYLRDFSGIGNLLFLLLNLTLSSEYINPLP
jgi:hypothetical protein